MFSRKAVHLKAQWSIVELVEWLNLAEIFASSFVTRQQESVSGGVDEDPAAYLPFLSIVHL